MQIVAEIAEASEIQSLVPAFHEFMEKTHLFQIEGKVYLPFLFSFLFTEDLGISVL